MGMTIEGSDHGRLRTWLGRRIKGKIRYWIEGPEVLHWDDPRRAVTVVQPTYAPIRTLESIPGQGGEVHVGSYSGLHHTATVVTGGQHHLDWVGVVHAHAEDGRWVRPDGAVHDKGTVRIGSDVWVGFEALLMSGITIGDGAVVAARAVVTKDVEPYSVVGGNPAKHLKYRFDAATREALLRIAWWEWSPEKVAAHASLIHSPDVQRFVALHDPEGVEGECAFCAGF